jgi:hypothetical protein
MILPLVFVTQDKLLTPILWAEVPQVWDRDWTLAPLVSSKLGFERLDQRATGWRMSYINRKYLQDTPVSSAFTGVRISIQAAGTANR